MINGAHFLIYSKDADKDKAFLRDVLGFKSVDVGRGWLIFKSPPSEMAVHPLDPSSQKHADGSMLGVELYLMCADVEAEIKALAAKGVTCPKPKDAGWGITTSIPLPSGGHVGLYQPKHALAYELK